MTDKKIYSEMLQNIFNKEYYGHYSDILIYIPKFFNLLQRIYRFPELDWKTRFSINCCFSYFAAPYDIIPDNNSKEGYIDDLYLCAYVLNDLLEENRKLVETNWDGEEKIDILIKDVLNQTSDILKDRTKDILAMVGILKFKESCQNESFIYESVDINTKIERIYYDIQELISLIKTVFISKRNRVLIRRLKDLKELFSEEQWEKVISILEKVKIHESKYDNRHELELEQIKRNVLLEIDESLMEDLK